MADADAARRVGMLVAIVSSAGHVVAAEADFESGHPMGFSVEDMQTRRASDRAWRKVMADFCHPDIAKAICGAGLAMDQIKRRLLDQHGWTEQAKGVEMGVGL